MQFHLIVKTSLVNDRGTHKKHSVEGMVLRRRVRGTQSDTAASADSSTTRLKYNKTRGASYRNSKGLNSRMIIQTCRLLRFPCSLRVS